MKSKDRSSKYGDLERKETMKSAVDEHDLKVALAFFSRETSFHGLKYISAPGIVRRFMWILLVVGGTILFVYQVSQQVRQYYRKPVNTQTSVTYYPSMKFPAITICNSNQFRISFASKHIHDIITDIYTRREKFIVNVSNFDLPDLTANLTDIEDLYHTTSNLMTLAAHQIEDMLLMCTLPNGDVCDESYFEQVYTDFGVCYTFNSGNKNKTQAQGAGNANALNLIFNLERYESMAGPFQMASLKVLMHEQGEIPLITSRSIDLPPGFVSMISLSHYQQNRIIESNSCGDPIPLKYYNKTKYSMDICRMDFFLDRLVDACQCLPYFAPQKSGYKECSLKDHFNCVIWQKVGVETSILPCVEACESESYRTSTSLAKIPDKLLTSFANKKNSITKAFNVAMEQRSRNENEEIIQERKITDQLDAVISTAGNWNLLPTKAQFTRTYDRLVADLHCYNNTVIKYKDVISQVVKSSLTMNDERTYKVLFMNQTIDALFTNTAIRDTIKNVGNKVEYYLRAKNLTIFLKELLTIYGNDLVPGELTQDSPQYTNFTFYYSLYKSGKITKKEWAENQTSKAADLDVQFSTRVSGPVQSYLEQVQLLINRANESTVPSVQFAVTNSSYDFWLVYAYLMAGYYGIFQNCNVLDFSAIYDHFWNVTIINVDTMTLPNGSTPEAVPVTCALDLYVNYTEFFKSILSCTYENLTEEIPNMVTFVAQVTNNFTTATKNLNQYLVDYLKNWDWSIQFYGDNILGLTVYYAELSSEITKQVLAYDIWDLFCDVGGSLGLFLGASFLTFFEVVDAFVFEWLAWKKYKLIKEERKRSNGSDAGRKKSVSVFVERIQMDDGTFTYANPTVIHMPEDPTPPYTWGDNNEQSDDCRGMYYSWAKPQSSKPIIRPSTSKGRNSRMNNLNVPDNENLYFDSSGHPFVVSTRPNTPHPYSWAHEAPLKRKSLTQVARRNFSNEASQEHMSNFDSDMTSGDKHHGHI